MAYPAKPQRPLTGPAPGFVKPSAALPVLDYAPDPPSRRDVLIAVVVLLLAFALAMAAYLAVAVPGRWSTSTPPRSWAGSDFVVASGTGAVDGKALVVTSSDATGTVLVSLTTDVRSADYAAIAWSVQGVPDGANVRMLWKSDIAPNRTNVASVIVEAGRLRPVILSRNPAWLGRVKGLALAIRAPLAEPLRIDGVTATPMGARQVAAERIREWFAFEAFNGASINTLIGGADLQDLPLPPLTALAVALATLALAALHRFLPLVYRFRAAYTLAGLFAVAWFVLDARWVANLAQQTRATLAQYGGKDPRERHLAAEDAPLYAFVEKARSALPKQPARIFVAADAHYFRGRAAYHLRPHDVWFEPFRNLLPEPAWLKAGDFLLVWQRQGVAYDAAQKTLRWDGGPPVGADLVVLEPGAALFRIL